jgi:hypothetical protein
MIVLLYFIASLSLFAKDQLDAEQLYVRHLVVQSAIKEGISPFFLYELFK